MAESNEIDDLDFGYEDQPDLTPDNYLDGNQEGLEDTILGNKQEPIVDADGNLIYEEDKDLNPDPVSEEDDIVITLLKSRGVNPTAIKVENEEGEIEEVSFYDLTREELLDLISLEQANTDDYDLDEEELSLINQIRTAGLTPSQFLEYQKKQILEQAQPVEETYQVDEMTDEELFLADLKTRIGDLTDEEAQQRLEIASSNEALFKKEVASIRAEYQKLEQQELEKLQMEELQAAEESFKAFEAEIKSAILDQENILDVGKYTLSWSLDDQNEVAALILDSDATGTRYLARALNDPKTLVQMAWFALKGQETISLISDYYKKEITNVSKTNYEKGYEDAKKGNQKNVAKSVVVKKPTPYKPHSNPTLSLEDLD